MKNWDKRFIEIVEMVAGWSNDPDTKTGALIVTKDNRIVSWGWNKIPTGVLRTNQRTKKPEKYIWTGHAEMNAILSAAKSGNSTHECTMYLLWYPCSECAKAIIQSGIDTVVCLKSNDNGSDAPGKRSIADDKYHFNVTKQMFEEAEIEVRYI